MPIPNGVSRRDFVIGCAQAAAVALAPGRTTPRAAGLGFQIHPVYRERTPLEAVLSKRVAGSDDFVLEKYHDQIAAILTNWSENLLRPGQKIIAIDSSLVAGFQGCSFIPSETKQIHKGIAVEVRQVTFSQAPLRERQFFIQNLQHYINELSEIITAEFDVTGIEGNEDTLRTEVRYELVGTGAHFYREQRSGTWRLEWEKTDTPEWRLHRWWQAEETRSRSMSPSYEDVTQHAFGSNHSYAAQLLHGVDYWRTVLDGASRIDIYGHNGIAVGDIDGDGLDDLYICQPAGLPNRLYHNRGDGTFEDTTDASNTGLLENTACALFADFSNSGRQDLIVVRADGPVLFVNDGTGKFKRMPDAFHFATPPQGTFTGAAIADYDRDGWLDIYFCLYVYYQGADQYKYPAPYYDANNGPPNFLMRNNRDGTFSDVTAPSGLDRNNTRYSFCCGWTDFNNDGWPDLCVVNDFGRKNLYRNNGDGTFSDIASQAGVEDVGAGMSVCSFDFDNDGYEDLYVADMWTAAGERITSQETFRKDSSSDVRALYRKHAMGNSLFRNKGASLFEDRTAASKAGMGRWSWSSDALDFDHDGFPDLYVTNGMISGPIREDLNGFFWRQVVAKSPEDARPSQAYEQGWTAINELIRADYTWSGFERNVMYVNNRDETFSEVSGAVGLDFIEDGRSFALSDFDHDGRIEIFLKSRNSPQLRLLKNVLTDLPPSISFSLLGTKSNRDAIGAAVTLETSEGRQTRRLQAGSGFLSQHSKELSFGLGDATGPIRASIHWPSGLVQSIGDLRAGHLIYVEEGTGSFRSEPYRSTTATPSPAQQSEALPDQVETWLLSPLPLPNFASRGKSVFLYLWSIESKECLDGLAALEDVRRSWETQGLDLVTTDLTNAGDQAAIYNILFRSMFDRHRDLTLPVAFLLNRHAEIVKIYQGPLNLDHVQRDFQQVPTSVSERIKKALPFPGNSSTFDFGRNYLSIGSSYFQRGYFEQAGPWFELALREDPSSAEAHYGLGSVYLKRSKTEEARASFEQALKQQASYPGTKANAWNNLGLIAAQAGQAATAVSYFQEALHLDADNLIALENLGNAFRQEKQWDDARSTLEHALAVGPDEPEVNYSLAMVFAQIDRPDRAYMLLQKALELRPNYPEAMNNLGVLFLRTHRRDQAVAEFEACIRTSPDFDQAYLNLARVYLIEGDREKARLTLLALLKQHPDHVRAQKALEQIK